MKLTKNEKKVLKLLLENARITDSSISENLKISSQAVGKIRRKLESTLIDSYTTNLNYAKLGLQVFAISFSKLTNEGLDLGELHIEKKLLSVPYITQIYRLPNSSSTHIIFYGFTDINSMDEFFHAKKNKEEIFKYIENKEIFTFSHNSLIKNDPTNIFQMAIDLIGNKSSENIRQISQFKKKFEE